MIHLCKYFCSITLHTRCLQSIVTRLKNATPIHSFLNLVFCFFLSENKNTTTTIYKVQKIVCINASATVHLVANKSNDVTNWVSCELVMSLKKSRWMWRDVCLFIVFFYLAWKKSHSRHYRVVCLIVWIVQKKSVWSIKITSTDVWLFGRGLW